MTQAALRAAARSVLQRARSRGLKIATAESCTGGLVAAALTEIAGSSDVFDRGFVTYSNDAKHVVLDVPTAILKRYGAVSAETAAAMAQGALRYSLAEIAVAITGIAGPGGGSKQKPVGLVHFAARPPQWPPPRARQALRQYWPPPGAAALRCRSAATVAIVG